MIKPELCLVCGGKHGNGMPCPEMTAMAVRLKSAVGRVMAASPLLMSDQYKFNGDEINGQRK